MLRFCGYIGIAMLLNPAMVGHPQSRPRYYFVLVRLALVEAAGCSVESIKQLLATVLTCFLARHPPADLDSFFLSEDHPEVLQQKAKDAATLRHMTSAECMPEPHKAGRLKWVPKHEERGLRNASSSNWRPAGHVARFPAFARLGPRMQELLEDLGVEFPSESRGLYNMSQSTVSGGSVSPTVTPGMILWLSHRGRLAQCREKAALQGLWLSDEQWSAILTVMSPSQVCDLAGNAFCTAVVVPSQLTAFTVLGRLRVLAKSRAILPRAPPRPRADR